LGEQGYDTTTKQMKVGDGVTAWTSLAYSTPGHIAAGTVLANPSGVLANPVGVDAAGMRTLLSSVAYTSQTLTSEQKSVARTNLAVSAPCRCGILANVTTEDTSSKPRFIEFFGGYMWGILSGDIYRSTDEGQTWTLYCNSWPDTGADAFIIRIIPTSDGEVVVMSQTKLRKSSGWATGNSATWSSPKVVPFATCLFVGGSLDGDGTKFIISEYSTTWPDSRYAHISLDSGNTWTMRYDSVTLHGSAAANASHVHAACYDPISDRFYVSEGHSTAGGVYASQNNGVTWTLLDRESLSFGGSNFNGPTVLVSTDTGIVLGSDNGTNGLYGILRQPSASDEKVLLTFPVRTGRDGLVMFAQRGWRDPETGEVYVTFRAEFNDIKPCICVGTPTTGTLLYEWPTLPSVGGSDRFGFAARTSSERLVAYAEINGVPTTLRADFSATTTTQPRLLDTGGVFGGTAHPTSMSSGVRSIANGVESTSVGVGASCGAAADSVAVGFSSTVTANNGVAIGSASTAGGSSVAVGPNTTSSANGVAVGESAVNLSINAVTVGYFARSNINGVAVGASANAEDYANSVALGANARVTGPFQVNIGPRHIELMEQTAPDAPFTANAAKLFLRDNGSGKSQLCVRFVTGAIQVIATEP
jgi:hypothetical protein